jgi:hypothetical protein
MARGSVAMGSVTLITESNDSSVASSPWVAVTVMAYAPGCSGARYVIVGAPLSSIAPASTRHWKSSSWESLSSYATLTSSASLAGTESTAGMNPIRRGGAGLLAAARHEQSRKDTTQHRAQAMAGRPEDVNISQASVGRVGDMCGAGCLGGCVVFKRVDRPFR